jgi:hypothetical protein
VIRNTYRELRDTTRKTFEQWIPSPLLGGWREQDFTFVMRFNDVHCEVLFRSLDRAEDIKKLLSLELTGAYINEAREVPQQALDMLCNRVGRYPSMKDGGPSWRGIWMDSNPWHSIHWAAKFFKAVSETPPEKLTEYGFKDWREYAELFRQPSGRSPQAENKQHLDPGYYARQCIGKDEEWIKVYVDGLDASAAPGSVYGRLIDGLRNRSRVHSFDHATDMVLTSWDLGYSDSTAIWFWRFSENSGIEVIDHWEGHGFKCDEWFKIVDDKPFTYFKHWLPHDARQKSAQTGLTIFQQACQHWPNKVGIVPNNDVEDGIAAARWLLEQDIKFHSRCSSALETMAAYRYEWDENSQTYGVRPVHDFASHTADAFRYLACVVKLSGILARKEAPKAPPKVPPLSEAITVDRLFEKEDVLARRKRI